MFWNELFVFLKCFGTNAHRVTHTQRHTVLPPHIVLYVLSIQMTSEMMNVVVISPLCCTSGRMGNQCESPQRHTYTHTHALALSHTHTMTTARKSQRHLVHHTVALSKDFESGREEM